MLDPSELGGDKFRRITRREYDRMVDLGFFDEDEHVELLRGMLVEMTPQGEPHAGIVTRLNMIFAPALVGRADVRVGMPFALSDDSEPEPDVLLVEPDRPLLEHPSQAMLVIEVSNTSLRKDRALKAKLYAEAGLAEYWVVNVQGRCIEVFREPSADGYRDTRSISTGAVSPGAFPDVAVDVDRLFAVRAR